MSSDDKNINSNMNSDIDTDMRSKMDTYTNSDMDTDMNSNMSTGMNSDMNSEIEAVLDEYVRPYLAAHGGGMKVDGVESGVVFFHLMGCCVGCAAADQTSEGLINKVLTERVPGIRKAILVNGISPEILGQTLELLRNHPSF